MCRGGAAGGWWGQVGTGGVGVQLLVSSLVVCGGNVGLCRGLLPCCWPVAVACCCVVDLLDVA